MHALGWRVEWQRRSAVVALVMVGGGVGAFGPRVAAQTAPASQFGADGPQALAARVAAGTWDRFTARVTVRREWVSSVGESANGRTAGQGQSMMADRQGHGGGTSEYVLERRRSGRGWKTRVTVIAADQPSVRTHVGSASVAPPLTITRIEDDEDGSAPRFFDDKGTEVLATGSSVRQRFATAGAQRSPLAGRVAGTTPGLEALEALEGQTTLEAALVEQASSVRGPRRVEGPEWVRAFVMTPNLADARRQAAQRALGRRTGWVRGYGQYKRSAGDRQVEVLLDEHDGVPMETNVVERGQLRSHTVFRYDRAASGALVKRGVRIERVIEPPAGADTASARVVTDITYSQVRLDAANATDDHGTEGGR